MSSYRPRRTRIYGANYDIGESYYKKQLESLDNKRGSTRLPGQLDPSEPFQLDFSPRESKLASKVSFLDDSEDLFKQGSNKAFSYKSFLEKSDLEAPSTIANIHTPKLRINDPSDDFDYEEGLERDIIKRERNISSQLKTSFLSDFQNEAQDKLLSRRTKFRSEKLFDEDESTAAKAASSRMKATKARLADLESEMLSITEKQSEREKRNSKLKKLLSESDSDALVVSKRLL